MVGAQREPEWPGADSWPDAVKPVFVAERDDTFFRESPAGANPPA